MRKLVLLRHAKSSWDDPSLPDHDRPLNARGRMSAPRIGRWLAAEGHLPELVLCSSARRTRETVERLRLAVPGLPEPVIDRGLYEAGPATLLARLRRLPGNCASAMLVGHQPGLGELLRILSDGSEAADCRRACEKLPTASAAVLEVGGDWSALAPGGARFVAFATPRDLEGD
jgi:phosphohistidine phosphatase